ncbi:hypothetical protein F0562_035764 [Nyssa sinensis]|uniref:Uncharacterized protein n=1 Tax=Nyssa sinensis TaxID=561372 RepID=A0A5J5ADU2_9ASTE|nr:hypothetical protein F0562_035764 [Nyssa sinensis]
MSRNKFVEVGVTLLEDSNNGSRSQLIFAKNPGWERLSEINGLWLCKDFLSSEQQSSLLSIIDNGLSYGAIPWPAADILAHPRSGGKSHLNPFHTTFPHYERKAFDPKPW